jgi:hypothetical protein
MRLTDRAYRHLRSAVEGDKDELCHSLMRRVIAALESENILHKDKIFSSGKLGTAHG